jgi:uncharacterized damage-inducible protein DinB
MITPEYVRLMAAYNAEMNRRVYAAAAKLTDAERKQDRGLFWKSLHGTLNHLLWGDNNWLARFGVVPVPAVVLPGSHTLHDDFDALRTARVEMDARLIAWAAGMDAAWLAQDQTWYSGAAKREMTRPRWFLLVHLFNHQTHHRGQAHAALTGFGQDTGDTDLFLLLDPHTIQPPQD